MKIIVLCTAAFFFSKSEAAVSSTDGSLRSSSTEIDLPVKVLQDREEIAFNFMMTELARVHKGVFALPYEYNHIKGVFMPEIEAHRLIIAPHYPSRAVVGEDQELAMQKFREWYHDYPNESVLYIQYVDQFISDHSNP